MMEDEYWTTADLVWEKVNWEVHQPDYWDEDYYEDEEDESDEPEDEDE